MENTIDGHFQDGDIENLEDGRVAIPGRFETPSERVLSYLGGQSVDPPLTDAEMQQAAEYYRAACISLNDSSQLVARIAARAQISVEEVRRRMLANASLVRTIEKK